jgi:hypothetical protein
MGKLNSRQRATLEDIFSRPTKPNIRWSDVRNLLLALGVEVSQGRGSRVRLHYAGVALVLHRPHPKPEMVKGAVEDLREFLSIVKLGP